MSTATDPFAVAPKRAAEPEVITAEQAISGVNEKIDALVKAELESLTAKVARVTASAKDLVVPETADEAEEIATRLRGAAKLRKDVENTRLGLTRRLDALKTRIKAPFDAVGTTIGAAEGALRAALLPYQERIQREAEERQRAALEAKRKAEEEARREAAERDRIAAEERKKAEELAAQQRKAQEEAARLEREAAEAKTAAERKRLATEAMEKAAAADELAKAAAQAEVDAGTATAEAEIAAEVAEAVAAPVNIEAESTTIRTEAGNIGLQKRWTHEVVDPNLVPDRFWIIDEAAIAKAYANDEARKAIADPQTGLPVIPGVRIFQKSVQRV